MRWGGVHSSPQGVGERRGEVMLGGQLPATPFLWQPTLHCTDLDISIHSPLTSHKLYSSAVLCCAGLPTVDLVGVGLDMVCWWM